MIINPEIITAEQINELCHERYSTDWEFWTSELTRDLEEYDKFLPTFNYHKFTQVIQRRFREVVPPIKVLDLGCGAGVVLGQLKQRHGALIECSGLSAHDFRSFAPESYAEFIQKVDIQIKDAHFVDQYYPPRTFDAISSLYLFDYLADPLGTLEKTINLLAPGGILQVYKSNIHLPASERVGLSDHLQKAGIYLSFSREADPSPDVTAWRHTESKNLVQFPFMYLQPESIKGLNIKFLSQGLLRYQLVNTTAQHTSTFITSDAFGT